MRATDDIRTHPADAARRPARYRPLPCLAAALVALAASVQPLKAQAADGDEPPGTATQADGRADGKPASPLPANVRLLALLGDRITRFEAVEMTWAIALWGPRMGGNVGWFHPSQSRYKPIWLAARYDADHDLTLTPEEFKGPRAWFDRLDRDHSGRITIDDFDWSDQSAFLRQAGQAGRTFQMMDANSNGRISRQEWLALFEKTAKDKDFLTPEDLRMAFTPPPRPPGPQPSNEGPTRLTLFDSLLRGELGSVLEGPAIDQPAPGFTLKTQDGSRTVSLADSRGKKPVVLIFGSFT